MIVDINNYCEVQKYIFNDYFSEEVETVEGFINKICKNDMERDLLLTYANNSRIGSIRSVFMDGNYSDFLQIEQLIYPHYLNKHNLMLKVVKVEQRRNVCTFKSYNFNHYNFNELWQTYNRLVNNYYEKLNKIIMYIESTKEHKEILTLKDEVEKRVREEISDEYMIKVYKIEGKEIDKRRVLEKEIEELKKEVKKGKKAEKKITKKNIEIQKTKAWVEIIKKENTKLTDEVNKYKNEANKYKNEVIKLEKHIFWIKNKSNEVVECNICMDKHANNDLCCGCTMRYCDDCCNKLNNTCCTCKKTIERV